VIARIIVFVTIMGIIAIFFSAGLIVFTLHQEVMSLHDKVDLLEQQQRPLIVINSKYPYVVASRKDIIVETNGNIEKNKKSRRKK